MVVIIGGIVFGVVTSTEAAALAAVWVVVLDLFVYRKLSWKIIREVMLETSLLTAVVMFCVGTATLFGWLMAYYQVIDVTEKVIGYFTYDPHVFLIVVMVLFLILGTFMDPAPAMMIFVPVLVPLAQKLHPSPPSRDYRRDDHGHRQDYAALWHQPAHGLFDCENPPGREHALDRGLLGRFLSLGGGFDPVARRHAVPPASPGP